METVALIQTSTIVPAVPTHRQHFYLSSLDLFWRVIHYNKRVLFYETGPDLDYDSLVLTLKESLALVLCQFFPWAGRLARGADGRFGVDCNDAGIEFVEASIDVPFSDLGRSFQMQPYFEKLAGFGSMARSDSCDTPLLLVQITRFLDGGFALGISQSHVVADGQSLWHFLVSWGEIARGIPLSKPPLHTRTALKLDNPSPERARAPFEFVDGNDDSGATPPKCIETVFHFSGEQIKKLKSMAAEGGGSFTSYEATCSHFWKCFARAKGFAPEEKLHFVVLVNCRKRLVPPLPEAYFGNAICNVKPVATAGELLQESLGATAVRIHEAIEGCNDELVRDFMHWLELRDTIYGNFRLDTIGMVASSSPRFPVYEVDFGWGKPCAARPARVGGEGEMCFFGGREGGGSVDICMKLECGAMESLENDPLFTISL